MKKLHHTSSIAVAILLVILAACGSNEQQSVALDNAIDATKLDATKDAASDSADTNTQFAEGSSDMASTSDDLLADTVSDYAIAEGDAISDTAGEMSFEVDDIVIVSGDEEAIADDTTSLTAEADAFFSNLQDADIGYTSPSEMELNKTEKIELVLGFDVSPELLSAELADESSIAIESVEVAQIVEARLTGQNFSISAITDQKQPISKIRLTKWAWDVTPLKRGSHTLNLTLSTSVTLGDEETPVTLRTFDREIKVRVDSLQLVSTFVANNWQWLWTTILVPITGFFWARRRLS